MALGGNSSIHGCSSGGTAWFVERTAEPVRFLREDDGAPEARGGERRRAGPKASADDRDVGAGRCHAHVDLPPHDR